MSGTNDCDLSRKIKHSALCISVNVINLNIRFEFDFVVIDWHSFRVSWLAEFTKFVGALWSYMPKSFMATWYTARILASEHR